MRNRILLLLLTIGIIVYIYRGWFILPQIVGGDWPYYYNSFLQGFSSTLSFWSPWQVNGLGGLQPNLGLHFFNSFVIVLFYRWLGLPWVLVYKIFWFGFFLLSCVFSIWVLLRAVLPKPSGIAFVIGALIFTTNTYVLMLAGGGQMGVALAYSIFPIVLASFIRLADGTGILKRHIRHAIIAGICLGFQLLLDPRIAYISLIAIGLFHIAGKMEIRAFGRLAVSGTLTLLLNAFWLLPVIVMRYNPLSAQGGAFTSVGAAKFFSFADFSHALSLLHPNWPENIFGKTYFLQPEFLIIPLFAFTSLVFINRKFGNRTIIFFALLGLLGAFLAKGANLPIGQLYIWMFEHIPGFIMFRDPTKFYILISASYAVLIPFAFGALSLRVSGKFLFIIFLVFWLFSIRPAVLGQLGGTFSLHAVPQEYLEVAHLVDKPDFFRTLWVPRLQRFAFLSNSHMAVEAEPLLEATNPAQLASELNDTGSQKYLSDLGIKYLVIPFDSLGELFLDDRRYSSEKRQQWEEALDSVVWLRKIMSGRVAIYETPNFRDRFWLDSNGEVAHTMLDGSSYEVTVKAPFPTVLYFSESFHPGWVAQFDNKTLPSLKTSSGINSFALNTPGIYRLKVYFAPQRYVQYGLIVSAVTLVSCLAVLLMFT